MRRGRAVAAVAVLLLCLLTAAAGAGQGGRDYGDAPDNATARYSGTAADVVGKFPSLGDSGGPAHAAVGPLRLGETVDRELDSRQVDRETTDDGFLAYLSPCRRGWVAFFVDAQGLPRQLRAKGHVAYLNAWFDWDRSGRWGFRDRCAAEWGVRNFPVDLGRFAGDSRAQAVWVWVAAGAQTKELWTRATLTLDQKSNSPEGRVGASRYGETEDYGKPPDSDYQLGVTCKGPSDPVKGPHGVPVKIPFSWYVRVAGVKWPLLAPPAYVGVAYKGGAPLDVKIGNVDATGAVVTSVKDLRAEVIEKFKLSFLFDVPRVGKISLKECAVEIEHAQDFAVKFAPPSTYDHDPEPQSDVCAFFATQPPQPGAKAVARLAGPSGGSVVQPAERSMALDGKGEGRARWLVNEIGRYTLEVEVTSAGVIRTAKATIDNSSPRGTCS